MRRALGPTQVTWLLSAGLAAGAVVLTTQTGGGPIIALHLPVAAVVVAPLVFVLTRLVASVLAFVWQRVSVDKMAYNSAAYAFEAAADALLVHLLLRPTNGLDLRTAVTLIALLAAVDQLIGALVLVM